MLSEFTALVVCPAPVSLSPPGLMNQGERVWWVSVSASLSLVEPRQCFSEGFLPTALTSSKTPFIGFLEILFSMSSLVYLGDNPH